MFIPTDLYADQGAIFMHAAITGAGSETDASSVEMADCSVTGTVGDNLSWGVCW